MEDGKKEVIKHSAAIQIHNNITLLQRRAWNILLANAYDELPTREEHSITIADLIRKLDFDSKNEDYLRESLIALVTCAVEWNILGKDKRQKWGVSTLLADAEIEGGICNYSYGPKLRKRLHNPTMYARISLSMQNRFESKYALALWELCVDFLDVSRNSGETRFIPLEDFMDLMGVDRGGYAKEFKVLRRFVITPAIKEINKVTDFHVEEEYKRQNRKYIAIKFKVKRVVFHPEQLTQQGSLFRDLKDMPTAVRELKNAGIAADEAWKIWQEGFNYVEMDKRPTNFKDTPEATFDRYVLEKIHLLKRMQAEGKVKNITGFLRTAIKKNYANPEFTAEEAKKGAREEAKTRHLTERKRQLLKEQRAEIEAARDTEAHKLCEKIAKETPALLELAAADLFKETPILKNLCEPGKPLLANYQEKPMLRVMMNQYLMAHYPERFQTIRNRYEGQIAAFDQKMIAEEQGSV